jgi:hypothetical protein
VIKRLLQRRSAAIACAAWMLALPISAKAATTQATVTASVVKPLTLAAEQNFSLGTIAIRAGTWSGATVRLSRDGVLSCSDPNLTCSGAIMVAKYRTTGSNNRVVQITAPNVILTNQTDPTQKLTLVPDVVSSVLLTSSGMPGIVFPVGGSITLNSSSADGLYTGTFNITVDYQ